MSGAEESGIERPWWTWLWPMCLAWFVVGLAWGISIMWMIDHG